MPDDLHQDDLLPNPDEPRPTRDETPVQEWTPDEPLDPDAIVLGQVSSEAGEAPIWTVPPPVSPAEVVIRTDDARGQWDTEDTGALDAAGEARGGRSCLRSCLFAGITLVVILSLLGTSLLALLFVRSDLRERGQQEIGALAPPPTPVVEVAAATPTLSPTATPVADAIDPPPLPSAQPTVGVVLSDSGESTSIATLNRIALVNAEGQIETLAPDGSDRRVLTRRADGSRYQFPTWSPDGERLAAVGSDEQGSGIYVLPDRVSASAADRQVYYSQTQMPFYLYWSPDSEAISFLANHTRSEFGLSLVPGDGASESQLLATGSPIYWEWAADSAQMLVHTIADNRQGSVTWIGRDGEQQEPNVRRPGFFQTPGISPSGRYLAVAEADGRESSLVLIDNTSDARRNLESNGSMALTWSPTADVLAYTSGRADAHPYWGPLRLLDAESGDIRELTDETVLAFFWSPDGSKLAFLTLNQRRPSLDQQASLPGKDRRLSRLDQPVQQPSNGFLRLSVMDVETGIGLRLLDFQPTAIFASQYLPFFVQYALSHRLWSPDSRSLVLPVMDDEFEEVIVIVPAEGGAPRFLARGEIAFWSQR